MKSLRFATAWSLTDFPLISDTDICVGPFGPNEVMINLRSHDSCHELYTQCVHDVTRNQMLLLDQYHNLIAGTGEALISTITHDKLPCGNNPETGSIDEDIQVLRPLVNGVSDATHAAADQLLKTLRWRLGKEFNYKLASRTGIYWNSLTDEAWRPIPSRPLQPGPVGLIVEATLTPTLMDEMYRRLTSNEVPALCFDILLKSRELIPTRPSLSLLGAVQAIEIGVKGCIARLCPQASWLAFEVPTPPISEILSEYLPTLIAHEQTRQQFVSFVELKLKDIRKVIHIRNRITHKGVLADSDQARFASDLASHVLYQLDFASGETWAANFKGYVNY